jgi:hypothetical protein
LSVVLGVSPRLLCRTDGIDKRYADAVLLQPGKREVQTDRILTILVDIDSEVVELLVEKELCNLLKQHHGMAATCRGAL